MPFMAAINAMSFHCRNMKNFTPDGVFWLTRHFPQGTVRVLRSGDVDYIWTYLKQEDYMVFASSWSPFVYLYTRSGELTWSIDPRIEGNYEAWYQAVFDAYSGGFNATQLYSGDKEGFDLQYSNALQWGYVVLLYRFLYTGGLRYSLSFVHSEVENVSRYNCEFCLTHFSKGVGYIIVGMTNWIRRPGPYDWFRASCAISVYRDENGVPVHIFTATVSNNVAADFFWMWGSRWMEDDCFYVAMYGNKEVYFQFPRWIQLYKFNYEGTLLASTVAEQFPTNSGHDREFDTGSGLLRTNDNYVIHFSTYGQYIRVWDKDLNFIKNIAVDASIGGYGYSTEHFEDEKWCQLLGFFGNEAHILVGQYYLPGGGGEVGGAGWHTIYVYDVSKDPGQEFQRTFRVYPPVVTALGTTKQEVFEEGITLEGYKG